MIVDYDGVFNSPLPQILMNVSLLLIIARIREAAWIGLRIYPICLPVNFFCVWVDEYNWKIFTLVNSTNDCRTKAEVHCYMWDISGGNITHIVRSIEKN